MTIVNTLINIVAAVGVAGCVIFAVWWHRITDGDWMKRTPAGPVLMITNAVLGTLFLLILANRLIPGWRDWPGRDWVLLLVYALYAGTPYSKLWLLRRAQQLAAKGEETP